MAKYNFDTPVDRKGTYATKWEKLPEGNEAGALPLWVADMDFPTATPIIKALHERVDKGALGYTYYADEVKAAVTGWFLKRYNWQVKKEDIFFSPGLVACIATMVNTLAGEGDGIVIQPPVYHPFAMKIKANGRTVVNNPLILKDGRYTMDFEDLDKKLADPKNKGLILCSPHNPTGRVWTQEELKKLLEVAKKHNKWIVSDEIHADLTRKGIVFTPLAKIAVDYADEIITLTAPSKAFNLAGLHMSNVVITKKEYKDLYNNWVGERHSTGGLNPFALAANMAAYNECEDWLLECNEYIDANVDYTMEFFKKELPKSKPVYIEGTYLFWVDLSAYEPDSVKLDALMKEAKIALNDGAMFGEEGRGFQRINLACPRQIVVECLNRMRDILIK